MSFWPILVRLAPAAANGALWGLGIGIVLNLLRKEKDMFDCSKEISKFHNEKVTLPETIQADLRAKRNANRDRVKNGLGDDYPQPVGMWSQGSYAMRTMVQAENNDFDIDDGVYFNADDLVNSKGKELTPYEAKALVKKAVTNGVTFKTEPDIKDNCVRVYYEKGYHVDIPVYRTIEDGDNETYELASADKWRESDPRAVTEWFKNAVIEQSPDENNGRQMRRVVRMMKDFGKANTGAGEEGATGFVISKLVEEGYEAHEGRDDKALYYTMKNIRDRLHDEGVEVEHPVVDEMLTNGPDDTTTTLLKKQIDDAMKELDILFETDKADEALSAWGKVFDEKEYFTDLAAEREAAAEADQNAANDDDPDDRASSIWVKSEEEVSAVDKRGGGRNA